MARKPDTNGAAQQGRDAAMAGRPLDIAKQYVDDVRRFSQDPAMEIPGMPPNFGRQVLPHVQTFQGLFGTYTRAYLEHDESLLDNRDNARWMENDCGVWECVESRRRSVALLDWQIVPEDDKSQEQQALATEMTKLLERMKRFTEYRMVLQLAIWYGRYGIQHRYGRTFVNGKERVMPIPRRQNPGWTPIHGDKLVFRYDDSRHETIPDQLGVLVGARHQAGNRIGWNWNQMEPTGRGLAYFLTDWEADQVVVHKHMVEDAMWERPREAGVIHGIGIRSRIYWDWFQKQEMLAFLMAFLERSAGGIEIWSYPAGNAEAKESLEEIAKDHQANGRNVILFPKPLGDQAGQYDVQVVPPSMAGIQEMIQLLNEYYGHRIKRYILGQTLSSEAAATGLGSGVADLHLDTLLQIIKYDATNLEETLTDWVNQLKAWNFPRAAGIHLRFVINTESPDVEKKLEAWAKAWEMGARIPEGDLMDLVGASMPTEDDRVLENPQIAQAEQMAGGQGMGMDMGGTPPDQGSFEERLTQAIASALNNGQEQGTTEYIAQGGKWVPKERYGKQRELFDESEHPRDDEGQFASKGGGSGGSTQMAEASHTGKGKEYSLTLADGSPVPQHLQGLRLPPAWTDVKLNTDPDAALLATGKDAKGRRQSVYSKEHHARQAAAKFDKIRELRQKAGEIANENEGIGSEEAEVLELIMKTGLRPGGTGATQAEKEAFGATTLQARHVRETDYGVVLEFTGKKGVDLSIPVKDPGLAQSLKQRASERSDNEPLFNTNAQKLREHTKQLDGGGFKPKDFRTLKGTETAARLVAKQECCKTEKEYKRAVREVAKQVSEVLGNTPTIALQSYIDPTVFSKWRPVNA